MPSSEVMHKFKHGQLHSGSKHGKKVTNRKQAIAIMMSEKRNESKHGSKYVDTGPSKNIRKKHGV
jgi:Family of unknown function (DUF6496)